jgi:hypothetical protein
MLCYTAGVVCECVNPGDVDIDRKGKPYKGGGLMAACFLRALNLSPGA